jgi:membrane protease YdiL (CAAX protease family)
MAIRNPVSSSERTFPAWRWVDLLLVLLGAGLVFVLGLLVYALFLRSQGLDPRTAMARPDVSLGIALVALEALAFISSVYLFGMRRRGISWSGLGLRPPGAGWVVATLFLAAIAIPVTGLVTVLVMLVLGLPLENAQLDFLLPDGLSPLSALLMFLLAGLAVPFAEELLFRGVLYPLLRQRWGVWTAVLLSALIFALIHGEIAVGVTAFLLGILLAFVYEFSGSLWTSILIHAVNNSTKIALLYLLLQLGYRV